MSTASPFSKRNLIVAGLTVLGIAIGLASWGFGWLSAGQDKVFDRFFTKHAAPSNIVVIAIDDESIKALGGWPFKRKDMATALENLRMADQIGIDIALIDPSSYGPADDEALRAEFEKIDKATGTQKITLPVQFDDRGGKAEPPLALYTKDTKEGYVNVALDHDGIVRRMQPTRENLDSMSVSMLEDPYSAKAPQYPPVMRINYRGPAKTFTTLPFIDVYRGTLTPDFFAGKKILIGVTANDLHDILQTPFGAMPGVEIHANALYTLQNRDFITDVPNLAVILSIIIASILAAWLIIYIKRLAVLLISLLIALGLIQAASVALFAHGILFPNLAVSLSFILTVAGVLIFQYLSESNEKRIIRKTFQYYLMPEVINELVAHPEKLALGGEKRKITILFSDIRGFTTLSESLSPEGLIAIINEYLTAMTDIIMEKRGLVDKYIGDAIMAFWGAPVSNLNQAQDACLAAQAMSEALRKLNPIWKARGLPPIGIGIGLNTGAAIVGNMGSAKRFNYTLMGDEVNFTSRLEGLTKSYGASCLISENTYKEIVGDPRFLTRELDIVIVKGKKEPRKIYELITEERSPELEKMLALFKEGRVAYMKGDFDKAIERFKAALAIRHDGPSHVFLGRSELLKKNPPAQWDGVYKFTTK